MAYNDIEIKSFVSQWNKIYDRTMKLLKDNGAAETTYLLFSFGLNIETGVSISEMVSIMNNDPQYIQAVRRTTKKRPHLSIVSGESEIMLMLCLKSLV